jgi:hypothetical protein
MFTEPLQVDQPRLNAPCVVSTEGRIGLSAYCSGLLAVIMSRRLDEKTSREGRYELGSAARSRRGEKNMARKTVVVSDMSGEQIPDGKGAKVRITFDDARSGAIEMDVTADEARAMGAKGRQVARRGRRPKGS